MFGGRLFFLSSRPVTLISVVSPLFPDFHLYFRRLAFIFGFLPSHPKFCPHILLFPGRSVQPCSRAAASPLAFPRSGILHGGVLGGGIFCRGILRGLVLYDGVLRDKVLTGGILRGGVFCRGILTGGIFRERVLSADILRGSLYCAVTLCCSFGCWP